MTWQSGPYGASDHSFHAEWKPPTDYTPALLAVVSFVAGLVVGVLLSGITVRIGA